MQGEGSATRGGFHFDRKLSQFRLSFCAVLGFLVLALVPARSPAGQRGGSRGAEAAEEANRASTSSLAGDGQAHVMYKVTFTSHDRHPVPVVTVDCHSATGAWGPTTRRTASSRRP